MGEVIWMVFQGVAFFLIAVTLLVFTCYPLLQRMSISLGGFEFFRFALKGFFWINFCFYLVVEAIFSMFFFAIKAVSTLWPAPMVNLFSAAGVHEDRGDLVLWGIISLVLLLIIMTPFAAIYGRVTRLFKFKALSIAQRSVRSDGKLTILSFRPKKLLPTFFVTESAKASERVKNWIKGSLGENASTQRFNLTSSNQDLMQYADAEMTVQFWECRLEFDAEEKTRNSRGKMVWTDVFSEHLFDGICIRLNDAFAVEVPSRLIQVGAYRADEEDDRVREVHSYNIIQQVHSSMINGFFSNKLLTKSNTRAEEVEGNLETLELGKDDFSFLQFVGVHERDLYLFAHTGLEGNLFEFHLNNTAAKNVESFKGDLEFVRQRITAAESLIPKLEEIGALPKIKMVA